MEFEKVKKIITEELGLKEDKITMDTTLTDDLGADSIDIFQIVMAMEDEFGIEFSNENIQNLKTVGDVVEYIKSL